MRILRKYGTVVLCRLGGILPIMLCLNFPVKSVQAKEQYLIAPLVSLKQVEPEAMSLY